MRAALNLLPVEHYFVIDVDYLLLDLAFDESAGGGRVLTIQTQLAARTLTGSVTSCDSDLGILAHFRTFERC